MKFLLPNLVTFVVVTYFVAFTTPSFASLGETLKQCEQPYGPSHQAAENKYVFTKDGMTILGVFKDNVCDRIFFSKESFSAFTPEEFTTVLTANSLEGKRKWTPQGEHLWKSDDGFVATIVPPNYFVLGRGASKGL